MKSRRCLPALSAGALLAVAGTVLVAPAAHAAELVVDVSDDSGGPGSLAAAIDAANATPGPDTIRIVDGVNVTTERIYEITETVSFVGGPGSIITNRPNYRGALFHATGGATTNFDTIEFGGDNAYGGCVEIDSTTEPTTINNLTISGVEFKSEAADFFHLGQVGSSIAITNSTFDNLSRSNAASLAMVSIDDLRAPLTLDNVNLSFVDIAGVSIVQSNMPADSGITIRNSSFDFVGTAPSAQLPGALLSVLGGPDQASDRSVPALTLSDIQIESSRSTYAGAIYTNGLVGDIEVTDGEVENSDALDRNAPLEFQQHTGNLDVTGSTFVTVGGSSGPARSLAFNANEAAESAHALRATNSTFYAENFDRIAHIALSGGAGAALDHVTLVGGGLLVGGAPEVLGRALNGSDEATVTMTNSVVGVSEVPGRVQSQLVEAVTGPEATAVSGTHNTVNALGLLPAAGNETVEAWADIRLGALGDYGGKYRTVLPKSGSPVIDAAESAGELTTDQRGFARTFAAASDQGAVEVRGGTVTIGDDVTVQAGDIAAVPVTYTPGEDDLGATVRVDILSELSGLVGAAAPGQDYHLIPLYTELTFEPGGASTKSLEVPTYVFNQSFDPLTFFAAITRASAGVAIGAPDALTVSIVTEPPAPPTVTNLVDETVDGGKSAEFSVTTTGEPAPTVVWEVSKDGGKTWESIDASWPVTIHGNTSTLTVPGDRGNDAFEFRATATDSGGQSAVSDSARLTVNEKTAVVPPGPDPDPKPTPGPGGSGGGVGLAESDSGLPILGGAGLVLALLGVLIAGQQLFISNRRS